MEAAGVTGAGSEWAREALSEAGRCHGALVLKSAGGAFWLEPATPSDVPELACLNLSVKLDLADCETALLHPETGFARRGGFFKVMDADELRSCLNDPRSLIFVLRAVAEDEDTGRIVASLWVSLDDPGFAEPSASLTGYLREHPALAAALREGRVCYGRELIVARDATRYLSPVAALFYGSFRALHAAGFAYALSEVYRVVEYHSGAPAAEAGPGAAECGHVVNIINEAALSSVAEAAGLRIARNRPRTLDFDGGLYLTIEPEIILFDLALTVETLAHSLHNQKAGVAFVNAGERGGSSECRTQTDGERHV
ncbi:MAG: hypothetical protein LBL23_09195 [Coriobacteriales bacterium]|nr:hypothetical protein [Coriobacteriales bacterium]